MNLKELFEKAENEVLTHDQFVAACKEAGLKLVDISTGDYVSRRKFDDELAAKDTQIESLNSTISQRDVDLKELQTKLSEAGNDSNKLTEVSNNLSQLQIKYDTDIKNYQTQLQKQAYEFAVKDFASSKNFSSKAAKRDFINSMIAKELKMDGDKILGADDFVNSYSADNEDAFIVDAQEREEFEEQSNRPQFVDSTHGEGENATGGFNFNFTGVRTHD